MVFRVRLDCSPPFSKKLLFSIKKKYFYKILKVFGYNLKKMLVMKKNQLITFFFKASNTKHFLF